jgi:hypothetical protein
MAQAEKRRAAVHPVAFARVSHRYAEQHESTARDVHGGSG